MVTPLLSTHTNHNLYPQLDLQTKIIISVKDMNTIRKYQLTHCLVPLRQPVVVVLEQPAAVLGQSLNGLEPQSTGQLLTAAHGPHSAAATAAATVPQCTYSTQLQHRRHEDISQATVPRHDGNARRGQRSSAPTEKKVIEGIMTNYYLPLHSLCEVRRFLILGFSVLSLILHCVLIFLSVTVCDSFCLLHFSPCLSLTALSLRI